MSKLFVDYNHLNGVMNPDTSKVLVAGNEHRFVRVAFDLFKLKDGGSEELWQIQADDDGNEFLVKTYNDEDSKKVIASAWSTHLDKKASSITVAYNGVPIHKLATEGFGVKGSQDADLLKDTLAEKLASDNMFVAKFVYGLTNEQKKVLAEEGGPIDPAGFAKAPGDSDEPYHGPGFQLEAPSVDHRETVEVIDMIVDRALEGPKSIEELTQDLEAIRGHVQQALESSPEEE